ncbi:MAG: ABC transporter ATP-binding protein [Betaproteobacteria bacterium]|nr:ABC transporter ATP-binding protein [Betaproteobacteria bacterium]
MHVAREQIEAATGARDVEVLGVSKQFGGLKALDDVSVRFRRGSVHALLGENGAGKSTLVKCLVGYYRPDAGQVLVDGRERHIRSPHDALALGLGMVYQHFTLVPSMTVAENLVMARRQVPAVINWQKENAALRQFMLSVPFKLDLDRPVAALAAGEKQKVEILKQFYLNCRVMILDEPTSVLTPAEADEVLGMIRDMAHRDEVTVLLITHKFREVMAFADDVTVLRRGRRAGGGAVREFSPDTLGELMVGARPVSVPAATRERGVRRGRAVLQARNLEVHNDLGLPAVCDLSLEVHAGEIVGIAGVSGNGQRELVEALIGQRTLHTGQLSVDGQPYRATRDQMRKHAVYSLPEEPLRNACVGTLSVADNMALRGFDRAPLAWFGWLRKRQVRQQAVNWIQDFQVKTAGPDAPMRTLSGGNVQRAVLARELTAKVSLLIVANPVFGLDFAAVQEVHRRLLAARSAGAAVLLVSEDLDELLVLSDRLLVLCGGRVVHQGRTQDADIAVIGRCMAGHGEALEGVA